VPEITKEPAGNSVLNPSRRGFAAMGVIAAAWSGSAVAAPLAGNFKPQKAGALKVKVDGNLFRPEVGEHPGLVMFASAAVSSSANAAVAQQLASQGWSVMLVDSVPVDDPARITRAARAHVHSLLAQPGVLETTTPSANEDDRAMRGFMLRSVSAAQPSLSLASREERRSAAASNILFAAPGALLKKDQARFESLSGAARALHRRAA
jgi:hypothetical protein